MKQKSTDLLYSEMLVATGWNQEYGAGCKEQGERKQNQKAANSDQIQHFHVWHGSFSHLDAGRKKEEVENVISGGLTTPLAHSQTNYQQ